MDQLLDNLHIFMQTQLESLESEKVFYPAFVCFGLWVFDILMNIAETHRYISTFPLAGTF
jgi:hypothetical protein